MKQVIDEISRAVTYSIPLSGKYMGLEEEKGCINIDTILNHTLMSEELGPNDTSESIPGELIKLF